MHFDGHLPVRFLEYWALAFNPRVRVFNGQFEQLIVPAIATLLLLGFAVREWRAGRRLPVFFLAWFVLTILPVVPLRDQYQTYYVTNASVGTAMLAAHAIASAWNARGKRRWAWGVPAAALAIAFLIGSIELSLQEADKWRARGDRAENVINGIIAAREKHPKEILVLDRVDDQLYWDIFPDGGMDAAGVGEVYLTPRTEARIQKLPYRKNAALFVRSAELLRLEADNTLVYTAAATPIRDITDHYMSSLFQLGPSMVPRRVELASKAMEPLLSGDWYPPEEQHRWMARHAEVRMAGPRAAGESLHVVGTFPKQWLADAPEHFTVTVDGRTLATKAVQSETPDFTFPLPAELVGKSEIRVAFDIDRTRRVAGDQRDLGIALALIEIK
jgi:hypothetical protein